MQELMHFMPFLADTMLILSLKLCPGGQVLQTR